MANIDTPGYRALGMDFEAEMRNAIGNGASEQDMQPTRVRFEDGLVARPDGNNVSMDRESLSLAETQLKYRTGIALLKQQYQMTMDAIRVDSGK
jgi:flagellar basal-body rod protein FlgB